LSLGGGAKAALAVTLDLNVNDLQLTSTPLASVQSWIVNARDGGLWDRPGLTSTSAKNEPNHATTLAAITGAQFHAVQGGTATFHGFSVSNTDVLVKYTWYGDTNYNGRVDGADYAKLDTNFNLQSSQGNIGGWANGDLDGNGKIDGADYALIDSAFNAQTGTLRPGQTVPEPASIALIASCAWLLGRRRRCREMRI
jgi:hypothetical protein